MILPVSQQGFFHLAIISNTLFFGTFVSKKDEKKAVKPKKEDEEK